MMAFAWAAWVWNYNTALVQTWSALYPGYEASLQGGFFGLAWGLLQGIAVCVVFAFLYNSLCPSFSICSCCRSDSSNSKIEPELKD